MQLVDDLSYHQQRARDELDWAYRARNAAAADAHMRLAGLHMQQLKGEDELCGGSYTRSSSRSR